MSEAIKLFGKTIPLPALYHLSSANDPCSQATGDDLDDFSDKTTASLHEYDSVKEQQAQDTNREPSGKEVTDDKQEVSTSNQEAEDLKDPTTTQSRINEKPETSSANRETSPSKESSENGEQQNETSNNSQEKTLKKPDKILPCPRCNSMDTKFCYYNNYNVNQPRHFCKNCQRYWTAGGTMRNVPVGAGRRKNKSSSASHYRHIIVSEALRTAQGHALNGVHNPSFGSSSTVLTFGADSPLCESVASMLNLSEKNGYHRPEQRILVPCGRTADNGDDRLSRNSVTASNALEKGGKRVSQETVTKNYQGIAPQIPCFPGPPWPYPWSSPLPTPPTFCPSGFPVSFYPAPAYWGCTVPNPWNVPPCLSPQSPSVNHRAAASLSPTSPLGKHSREGNILKPVNSEEPSGESNCTERSVLAPKALRIDDPTEAVTSSIWATLGIKCEKTNLNGGLFEGFQSKNENRNYIAERKSSVLQVNPAALSRSLNFHEST